MADVREGGCLCGNARYSIDVEDGEIGNCHCTICRKHSGAPYETYINVKADKFQWVTEPKGYIKTGDESGRQFCKNCGTPLSFLSETSPEEVSITAATIDDPSGLIAQYEIYTSTRMDGVPPVAGAKQFALGGE
jgi:hypothetical protein